jgi:hypothetical protein
MLQPLQVSIVVYTTCKSCVSVNHLRLHEANVNICQIHLHGLV